MPKRRLPQVEFSMNRNRLFADSDLDDRLGAGARAAAADVDQIPENQFLASSDDELVDHLKGKWTVDPLVLDENSARMEQKETNIDVSNDPNRYFSSDDGGPHFVPGTAVTIHIPYIGTAWLWNCQTNPYSMTDSLGSVTSRGDGGVLETTVAFAHDVPREQFKERHEQNMRNIRTCIERGTAQVASYNQRLEGVIRTAIAARRQRLGKHADLATLLKIPLQERAGAPPLQRILLQVRRPPPLPVPPKGALQPEPGITDDDYEKILSVIRHEGRTFETTPKTFAKHDEEELRDIILAHLNGHFEGVATGETFRRKGKTDICIEDKERSAFIGECKVWNGAGEIGKALEQLLSYLTWRDSKAALVVFNTSVARFSELPERMRQAVVEHRFFVSEANVGKPGEYRFVMRSAEDDGRRVKVHVFLFNLYCP